MENNKMDKNNKQSKETKKEFKATSYSLHTIENITNINQLAEHYDLIVSHARLFLNTEDTYDLVHDLFIKLDTYFKKYPDKVINGGFISNSLRNMVRNIQKVDGKYIDYNVEVDEDFRALEDIDFSNETINMKIEKEFQYEEIELMLQKLTWVERTVLEYSLVMPLTEVSRLSGIAYQNLVYQLNNAKEKLGIKKPKVKKTKE